MEILQLRQSLIRACIFKIQGVFEWQPLWWALKCDYPTPVPSSATHRPDYKEQGFASYCHRGTFWGQLCLLSSWRYLVAWKRVHILEFTRFGFEFWLCPLLLLILISLMGVVTTKRAMAMQGSSKGFVDTQNMQLRKVCCLGIEVAARERWTLLPCSLGPQDPG